MSELLYLHPRGGQAHDYEASSGVLDESPSSAWERARMRLFEAMATLKHVVTMVNS